MSTRFSRNEPGASGAVGSFSGAVLTRTAWFTLAVLSALNLLNYFDRYILAAVLTPLQHDLGLTDGEAGWAASAFMLGYFITAPLFGFLGDRYPRKFLMLAGVIGWSLATAATGFAQTFLALIVIRVAVGIGEACFVTMGPSWLSDLFSFTRRNTALTLFYIAVPVGSAIGFTVGGLFAQYDTWRHAFIYAGLPGVLLALTLLLLREPARGEADGLPSGVVPPARGSEVLGLLGNRRFLLLLGGYSAQTFAIGGFAVWGPTFLVRTHGFAPGAAATIFGAILAGSGLVSTLVGGFGANAIRRRTPTGYVWMMAGSITAAVPVCALALTSGDATVCLVGLGLSMFLLFLPTGPISSEIFEIVPVHLRASGMALCTFGIHLLGDLGSPTAIGLISDATHSLQKGVLLLPLVLLLGAAFWIALLRQSRTTARVTP